MFTVPGLQSERLLVGINFILTFTMKVLISFGADVNCLVSLDSSGSVVIAVHLLLFVDDSFSILTSNTSKFNNSHWYQLDVVICWYKNVRVLRSHIEKSDKTLCVCLCVCVFVRVCVSVCARARVLIFVV